VTAENSTTSLAEAAPLVLVGAGKMGGAMLAGWLARGLPGSLVTVIDPNLSAETAALVADHAVRHHTSFASGGEPPRVVVLAVKPQLIAGVLPAVRAALAPETVVVSVAAGTRLATLREALGDVALVRVMPNTPALVGRGMAVAVAGKSVSLAQRDLVTGLMAAVGDIAWVDDEALIDAVTAVSGSGPAYVFLLAECLAEAGRRAGLPDALADRLARATVTGVGELLHQSAEPPDQLRRNVTSPNGTTAAALAVLMAEDGLQPLLTAAVEAARRRSVELG
jgi:pyrroline-5-carboxylate reductase